MEMGTTDEKVKPPLKKLGVRHVQCLLLFLGTMFTYTLRVSMSVAIVAMKNATEANPDFPEYEWDQNTSGYILTSFYWGYIVAHIPCGYLVTVMSAQKLLACGIFLSSAFTMLVPFFANQGVVPLILCRVAMGVFQGCLMPCLYALLSRWVPPGERNRLGTFVFNGMDFGTVITMPITGYLVTSSIGWPSAFYIFGSGGILWSIVYYFMGSNCPSEHPFISSREVLYINESIGNLRTADRSQNLKVPWKSIFTSVPVWALTIVHCGYDWGSYTLLTEMPTYMKNVLNIDTSKIGGVSSLPYLVSWTLGFPISYLGDLAQRKGVSTEIIRKVSNTLGLCLPAMALVVLNLVTTTNTVTLVALLVVTVSLSSTCCCGYVVNHMDLSPNFAGLLMSMTNLASNVSGTIAPMVCSAITNEDEDDPELWHIVFYIAAAVNVATNLVFVIFGKAEVQSWNEPEYSSDASGDPKRTRVSVTSIPEKPTSLTLPE